MLYTGIKCPVNEVAYQPSILANAQGYLLAYRCDTLDERFIHSNATLTPQQYWGVYKRVAVTTLDVNMHVTGNTYHHWEGEDPRLFRAMDRTWCAYSTCPRSWRVFVAEVRRQDNSVSLGDPFLPDWQSNRYVIGGPDEKNWTWIDGAKHLDCIQMWNPFCAVRFDEAGVLVDSFRHDYNVHWKFGPVWGGTPSVLLPSGERFSVFHGYLSGGMYNRCYYAGGIFHEPEWPYKPIRIIQKPLLSGARRLKRWPWLKCRSVRTRVVFPCGLMAKPDRVVVSYGVDDCACAFEEFTYSALDSSHI